MATRTIVSVTNTGAMPAQIGNQLVAPGGVAVCDLEQVPPEWRAAATVVRTERAGVERFRLDAEGDVVGPVDTADASGAEIDYVGAYRNTLTGGNDFSGDVSTLKLPAGVTDLTGGVSGGGGYAVAQIHTPSTSPADTAENTLFSAALPSLGASDTIQIEVLFTCTNNANTKTVRLYLDSAMFAQTSGLLGSQPNARAVFRFSNRGNAASQIATNFGIGGGALTGAVNTTVDTSTEKIVSITVQKGNSSDSVVLESAIVTRIAGS